MIPQKPNLINRDKKNITEDTLGFIFHKVAKSYSDRVWLKVLIQQLPYVGPAIDTVLTDSASKIWQKKVEQFLYLLAKKLQEIEEQKIDKDFVKTGEFIELLRKVIGASGKSYEKEKLEYFANILKTSVLKENSEYYFKENFIKIVSEVSGLHIAILKFIHDRQKDAPVGNEKQIKNPVTCKELSKMQEFRNFPIYLLEASATELIRYGLLYDWSIGRYDYSPGKFAITEYARDFIKFVFSR